MTQELDDMRREVESLRAEKDAMTAKAENAQQNAALTNALAQAGATDMEVALLLAQQHTTKNEDGALDACRTVAAVREQRPWLFAQDDKKAGPPGLTAGARSRGPGGTMTLTLLAEKARQTGSAKDLQAYMLARRNRK